MDVKYQIFVSSTFDDLKDERRAVIEAILNLGHIPVGMEVFQANDETQWAYIKNRIDESDYYVVIVAERYGSEQDGKSYTQMEYEYAVKKGIPAVAFLLDSDARKAWPASKVEFEKKGKVDAFRSLCQQKLVKFWRNADDLGGRVAMTLVEQVRIKPRVGWVRADSMPTANVMNELAALSEEKRQLQAEVARLSTDSETLQIPQEVAWRLKTLDRERAGEILEYDDPEGSAIKTMLDVFLDLIEPLARSANSTDLTEQLGDILNIQLDEDDVEKMCLEFVKNDLVGIEQRMSRGGFPVAWYSLTSYGKQFLMYAKEWNGSRSADSHD